MSPQSPTPCTHDRGPGITVCLRCRQEERARAMNGLRRTLGIGAGVAVAILVIGVGTARSWQARPSAHPAFPTSRSEGAVEQQGSPAASPAAVAAAERAEANVPSTPAPTVEPNATSAAAPAATPVVNARAASAPTGATPVATSGPALIAKAGRTSLANGVVVEHMGDSAIVSFDSPEMRTRHLYKFERIVRRTLPALYGAVADSVLARFPEGDLMDGDLLKDVARRGARLPLASGGAILITPETRAGEDGPLVVRYHTRIVPR